MASQAAQSFDGLHCEIEHETKDDCSASVETYIAELSEAVGQKALMNFVRAGNEKDRKDGESMCAELTR